MSIQKIRFVSKIPNINNSCALDALTMYLELLPEELSTKIINYFDNNLRTLILKLEQQLYIDTIGDYNLIHRLHLINKYFKKINKSRECDFISLDEILFENEKLLESGLITETAHDYKKASIQLVNISNSHYVVKLCLKDINEDNNDNNENINKNINTISIKNSENKINNDSENVNEKWIYLDDLPEYQYINEQIVLIHNFNDITEINNVFKKIMNMGR